MKRERERRDRERESGEERERQEKKKKKSFLPMHVIFSGMRTREDERRMDGQKKRERERHGGGTIKDFWISCKCCIVRH